MKTEEKQALETFFESIESLSSEELMKKVEQYLDDDAIEMFVNHIEDFYGIEDDEELGMLAQLMISGFMAAKSISAKA